MNAHYCFACNNFFSNVLEICGSEITHYQCPICHTDNRMISIERMVDIIKHVWSKEKIDLFLEGKIEIRRTR